MAPPDDDAPDSAVDDAAAWLADLFYTGVGLGLLAVNRFQVARRSAQKALGREQLGAPGLGALSEVFADPERRQALAAKLRDELQDIDDRLDGVENRFNGLLERIEPDLPDSARVLSSAIRGLAQDHAGRVRSVLGLRSR